MPPFELSASSQTGLFAANPSLINLHLAVQRLPRRIHHRPPEFVKHHPNGFITGQAELTLQQQSGYPTLVRRHKIGGPKPMRQGNLRPVEDCPGGQRNLVPAAGTLSPPPAGQLIGFSVSASWTDEPIRPTTGGQILLAAF